jgi:hypothetical protein
VSAKSDPYSGDVLNALLNSTVTPWHALAVIYWSLHTSDPGPGGNQATSEASYGGYGRPYSYRTGGHFTTTGNQSVNDDTVSFPTNTGSPQTVSYVCLGMQDSGVGEIFYRFPISPPLVINNGDTPTFAPGDLVIQET